MHKIENIIKAHLKWKKELEKCLESKVTNFSRSFISNSRICNLGIAIDGELTHLMDTHAYAWLKLCHDEFHKLAGIIYDHINNHEYEKANELINGRFNQLSVGLISSLKALKHTKGNTHDTQ